MPDTNDQNNDLPITPKDVRVPLGRIVATSNALGTINPADIMVGLRRHVRGDWGELDEHDRQVNEQALRDGSRLLSAYTASTGRQFWIITEWDRSVTTILLPEDY